MNHNNIRSHRLTDSTLNWGNDFFPEENKAISVPSFIANHNTIPSSNINLSSSSSSDLVNYGTHNLGVSSDPYLHCSVRRSSLIPQTYLHRGSYYNQHNTRGSTSAGNSEADFERLYFKRKSSAYPVALDIMNSDEYYNVRNLNRLPISSDQYTSNPNLGPHSWSHRSTSMLPGYPRNCPSTIGEISGSHRNVRSRNGHALQLENNSVSLLPSSSLPHHFNQTPSTSGHSAMPFNSRRRFPSPGFFHHEINQLVGSRGSNAIIEFSDQYSDLVTNRNTATTMPTLPDIPTHFDINYAQRLNPYSSSRNTSLDDIRRFENEFLPHWSHHRLGQNDERRLRSLYDSLSYRMNTLSDEEHTRARLNDEDEEMIDSSVFYDPPAMFDQHRNMRMDVDSMSYEELIALGERIGNVSTGLSEDDISKCLTRKIHSFDRNQDANEGSCVICLVRSI